LGRTGDRWVVSDRGGTTAAATAATVATAAPSGGGGSGCLDCLHDVVRALSMGSCLTAEQRPATAAGAAPGGKEREGRTTEEEVPGRIAGNGVGSAACLFTRQGRKGTNQDAMVVWEVCNVYLSAGLLRSPFLHSMTIDIVYLPTVSTFINCQSSLSSISISPRSIRNESMLLMG
jgi:hypothetical protein